MRILVDINHPAHVHLFKNLIGYFKSQGYFVYVSSRDKDSAVDLLDHYEIPHQVLSTATKNPIGMSFELMKRDLTLIELNRRYNFEFLILSFELYKEGILYLIFGRVYHKIVDQRRLLFALTAENEGSGQGEKFCQPSD